jgi:hypothetical protein
MHVEYEEFIDPIIEGKSSDSLPEKGVDIWDTPVKFGGEECGEDRSWLTTTILYLVLFWGAKKI